ncbi:hypothetical protein ACSBR1_016934 [Camellia fascicularis]
MAASKDGMYLAVAGLHGLILYELLFYPQYHLNQSSLHCRKPLFAKPVVMDVFQGYLLVTYRPFDVHIFHVKFSCELAPSSTPDLPLSPVGELSDMTAKSHPAAMRFIHDQLSREHVSKNQISTLSDLLGKETVRANGELALLDLDDGRERVLTDSVELFWACPELEFDREVYLLGLLPNAGVVGGVSQRISFSARREFPCFEQLLKLKLYCIPSWECCLVLTSLLVVVLVSSENVIHLAVIGMGGISYLAWGLGLFEECFQQRWYWTGSLYTCKPPLKFLKASKRLFEVVIAELEDPTVSQYCALCLLQIEFYYYFFGSSLSFKEQNAHVTSVKNILESHASNLMAPLYQTGPMSGKKLSKLVAFVKGAQFDLLEYLQRKRYGSACLENFASGIKLIGQKVIEVHIV